MSRPTSGPARLGIVLIAVAGALVGLILGAGIAYAANCPPTCTGSNGADTIYGNANSNNIDLLGGNDHGYAYEGNDTVRGGPDRDEVDGMQGDDTNIIGGDGFDGHDGHNRNPGEPQVLGGAGNDDVYGGAGNDDVIGENGGDQLFGEEGDDELNSQDGEADNVWGGGGSDQCWLDPSIDFYNSC